MISIEYNLVSMFFVLGNNRKPLFLWIGEGLGNVLRNLYKYIVKK